MAKISPRLKETYANHKILLTDLYPNIRAMEALANQSKYIEVYSGAVDARYVPKELMD